MTKPTAEDPEGQALAKARGLPRREAAQSWGGTPLAARCSLDGHRGAHALGVGPGAGGPRPARPQRAWLRLAPFSPFPTALSIEECRHRRISPGACPGGTVTSVMGFTLQVQPS